MLSIRSLARRFSKRAQSPHSMVLVAATTAAVVASAGSIAGDSWAEHSDSNWNWNWNSDSNLFATATTTRCLGWFGGRSSSPSPPPPGDSSENGDERAERNEERDDDDGDDDDESLFHGQCLKRQMHTPVVPYPLWDYNWDGKMTSETSLEAFRSGRATAKGPKRIGAAEKKSTNGTTTTTTTTTTATATATTTTTTTATTAPRTKPKRPKRTRHLLLVRHGQYDERWEDDERRKLTPLGRRQAIQTGKRLADIARGGAKKFKDDRFNGRCLVRAIHVSNMERAKETAALIAQQFGGGGDTYADSDSDANTPLLREPDPMLNEALPAPMVPIRPDIEGATEEIDEHHDRIEAAFRKYFYRDDNDDDGASPGEESEDQDEFEVIVCHGNVIRYFFCRALQLPPEAWLRLCTFNCSITYLVIRPNGMVSARMMGDIGHLEYHESTFSGYHGFKW